jgi:hypothetical protein
MLQLLLAATLVQDYFPLGEGHSWRYETTSGGSRKEVVKTVTGKEKIEDADCFIVEDQGWGGDFQKLCLQRSKDGIQVLRMRREMTKPFPWLKFPLEKGVRWVHDLAYPRSRDRASLEFTVEEEEEVVVPAGTYKARRVRLFADSNEGKLEVTMWYAADVGEVKRAHKVVLGERSIESTTVLLKFSKGK